MHTFRGNIRKRLGGGAQRPPLALIGLTPTIWCTIVPMPNFIIFPFYRFSIIHSIAPLGEGLKKPFVEFSTKCLTLPPKWKIRYFKIVV